MFQIVLLGTPGLTIFSTRYYFPTQQQRHSCPPELRTQGVGGVSNLLRLCAPENPGPQAWWVGSLSFHWCSKALCPRAEGLLPGPGNFSCSFYLSYSLELSIPTASPKTFGKGLAKDACQASGAYSYSHLHLLVAQDVFKLHSENWKGVASFACHSHLEDCWPYFLSRYFNWTCRKQFLP